MIQKLYPQLDQEIAVLHIGGKGEFRKWRDLFTAYGLTVSAIADFDYIANLHYKAEKGKALKTAKSIADFKARNPDWETHIDAEYRNRTFILKEGDLEAYLGIGKNLDEVINFCRTALDQFFVNDGSKTSREVQNIIEQIVA